MPSDLLQHVEAAKARNRALESVRGSGYHDDDKDHRGRPSSPQRNGLPRVSEHLIALWGEDTIVFAGADAEAARKALDAYHSAILQVRDSGNQDITGTMRNLIRWLPRHAVKVQDDIPTFSIPLTKWNDYLEAFYAVGIGITGITCEA